MKLFSVSLQKHDTCFTYALKRVGKFTLWEAMNSAEDYLESKVTLEKTLSPEKGDVLVCIYPKDDCTFEYSRGIDESGRTLWKEVYLNLHFMVYEGSNIISEAVLVTDSNLMEIQRTELSSKTLSKSYKLIYKK